jgi:AraC-like DNA-binding protein
MARSAPVSSFHHYLPIMDDIFHDGFYITSGGCGVIRASQPYPSAGHPQLYDFDWREGRVLPEFALILISAGAGIFQQVKMPPVSVRKRSVILLFPGVWHRYRPEPATGWTEKWFQFNGEFAHRLLERGLITPEAPVLRPRNFSEIEHRLDRMLQRIHQNPTSNSLVLSLEAQGIISQLFAPDEPVQRRSEPSSGQEDPLVATALSYIWTHNHRTISVEDVARHAAVNRRTLERHFSDVLGQSVLEQIIQCRFSRAERLLRETNLSIKSIVSLAGFGTEENMRKTFINRTQRSPAFYRKRHAGGS